jgi:hypothetical protein
MPEAIVDPLEVVDVREHERERAAEARGAGDLRPERIHEAAPVRQAGELVRQRLTLDDVVQLGVLECDRRLGDQPARQLDGLGGEAAARWVEHDGHVALLRGDRERDPKRRLAGVLADPRELAFVLEQATARGAGRLDSHLEDHGQERARVVRGREGVTEQAERLTRVALNLRAVAPPLDALTRPLRRPAAVPKRPYEQAEREQCDEDSEDQHHVAVRHDLRVSRRRSPRAPHKGMRRSSGGFPLACSFASLSVVQDTSPLPRTGDLRWRRARRDRIQAGSKQRRT